MKRNAAARSVTPMMSWAMLVIVMGIRRLQVLGFRVTMLRVVGFLSAGLEHREHAAGDGIAAGGIAGAEQHGEEPDRLLLHRAGVEQGEHAADHHDAMHEIGAGHQRCVQYGRHMADDDPAGKGGEHEDVQGHEAGYLDRKVHRAVLVGLRPLSRLP